ncbi:hypothetical protein HN011_009368 [Eciton burchellii]|nr:hypothetical protein HN011_009368 [Eciton burchellii]
MPGCTFRREDGVRYLGKYLSPATENTEGMKYERVSRNCARGSPQELCGNVHSPAKARQHVGAPAIKKIALREKCITRCNTQIDKGAQELQSDKRRRERQEAEEKEK